MNVGTALASGSLKVKSDLKLKGNTLDLQNDLHLEQVKTSTVDPALAAQLDKKLPVPLDAALGMLSDSKGNIDLQIPVEGKLDDLSHKMEHHATEARTDVLTGLANRRAFQEEAARCYGRFRETDQPLSLIMIDIDIIASNYVPGTGGREVDGITPREMASATGSTSSTRPAMWILP